MDLCNDQLISRHQCFLSLLHYSCCEKFNLATLLRLKHPCPHKPSYLRSTQLSPTPKPSYLISGYAHCEIQLSSIVSQRGRYGGTGNRTGDFASSSSRGDAGPKGHWANQVPRTCAHR